MSEKPKPAPEFSWDEIDALRSRVAGQEIPAHAITANDYAERYGIPRKTADGQLRSFVQDGFMQSDLGLRGHPARLARCYWPTKEVRGKKDAAGRTHG